MQQALHKRVDALESSYHDGTFCHVVLVGADEDESKKIDAYCRENNLDRKSLENNQSKIPKLIIVHFVSPEKVAK